MLKSLVSRVLIYSDVHGNLPAFEAMLSDVGVCDAYICLGDLVNYGPWSNECVDLASSLPQSVVIMGNHEEAFIAGKYPGENKLVQYFFLQTYPSFSRLELIKRYPAEYRLRDHTLVHTIANSYIYPDTQIELDDNYVIGHSHHQFVYRSNGFTLYNAGSVGQNRKFINVVNYLIYDSASSEFLLGESRYDVDVVINEMVARKYPKECVDYYRNKQRQL